MSERITQLVRRRHHRRLDDLDPPQIATYNSYANRLYRDNASAIGREGDGAVLGEAAAWQLARTTVTRSADLRLLEQDRSLDALTEAVLAISRAIADNVADAESIRRLSRDFAGCSICRSARGRATTGSRDVVENIGQLDLLVDLAEEYGGRQAPPRVRRVLRPGRARARDPACEAVARSTSSAPSTASCCSTSIRTPRSPRPGCSSELYRGHPVMAVGDPNQSIYGWRGASAGNLAAFPHAVRRRRARSRCR